MAKSIADKIYGHPDREEIVAKLLSDVTPNDISEAICARYSSVEERKFCLSERQIKAFKDDYLDFYTTIKNDLAIVKQVKLIHRPLLLKHCKITPHIKRHFCDTVRTSWTSKR